MRFALLGKHPDGVAMASALVASSRHQVIAYTHPGVPDAFLRQWGPAARQVGDLEEVLADPAVDAVIVAGSPANRPAQLRRALQSERHVLCVHPADASPDLAYEAALIQGDTGRVLLPLLPALFHPAVVRLAGLCKAPDGPVGLLRLVQLECWASGAALLDPGDSRPSVPGWEVLRLLGGEVAEVSALAAGEELSSGEPVLLTGRFERGGLFQASFLPGEAAPQVRLHLLGPAGRAELLFPLGHPGPAFLSWHERGEWREEAWDIGDPWPALVESFETAVEGGGQRPSPPVTWQDAVRCLELDDAARRSLERRRASTLEYPEPTEEVGFKGTMTLVGCGLLWVVLLLMVLSYWLPALGWLILPALAGFLLLQLLRWVVPSGGRPQAGSDPGRGGDGEEGP